MSAVYVKINSDGREVDRIVADSKFITTLDGDWSELTEELEIDLAIRSLRLSTRASLRVQWDALPAWINGPYRPLFDAANRLLDEGLDEAAFEMIDSVEPNTKIVGDLKIYPELGGTTRAQYFAAVKEQFLSVIKSL